MSATHIFFLGLFATALIGALGWIISTAYRAFKDLIETVSKILVRLESTITKMDERFASQQTMCSSHKQLIAEQNEGTKERIEKVEDRIEKVEDKIDKHIENHNDTRRRRA